MKKILTSALALVLFIGAANAQDGGRHRGKDGQKMAQELNLTADQQAKFKSLHEAERKEMEALKQDAAQNRDQRKAIHDKYKTQYEAILTPEQKAKWNEKKGDWKEDHKGKGKGGDRGDRFGQMAGFYKKELNLTADQETRLKGIFDEFRTKAKDLRANTSLTREQQKTQMQTLTQQYTTQAKAVLTPEQAQKFEQLKNERMHKRDRNG